MRILSALKAHDTDLNPRRRAKKAANYTLSKSARWYCRRLKKPLQKTSESGVAEALILKEAERLGLKKPEQTNGVHPEPEAKAA